MEENGTTYSPLDETLQNLVNLGEEDELGLNAIVALFQLPDEQFDILAPAIMTELEHSLKNDNDKIQLANVFKAMNIDTADMATTYSLLRDTIFNELGDSLSENKKNFLEQMLMTVLNIANDTQEAQDEDIVLVPIEKYDERAKIPVYAHVTDSGADLYALEDITIQPGETILVKTGLKVAIPRGYELQVRPKSGVSLKTKLRVANTPGTIDAGYRDEIGVIIDNIEPPIKALYKNEEGYIVNFDVGKSYTIGAGQKFAQLVLMKVSKANFQEVKNVLSYEGDRGGGFGSTGLK